MGKMSRLREALYGLAQQPSLVHVRRGTPLASAIAKIGAGHQLSEDDIRGAFGLNEKEAVDQSAEGPMIIPAGPGKAVALLSMRGVHLYDFEWQPYCFSSKMLRENISRLADDKDIGTIVLLIDSPGGVVTGLKEAADAIFAARKKKPVIAVVDPLCASAAYWLASQATEISVVPSADIGSVGVFMLHVSYAGMLEQAGIAPTFIYAGKYKVEGNPYEPLSDEAKQYLQEEVNETYADFIATIARGRGLDAAFVDANFGQGRCLDPDDAKKAKMIDTIAPVSVTLSRCGIVAAPPESRRRSEAAASTVETKAVADVGSRPIEICTSDDGYERRLYITREWPKVTSISPTLFNGDPEFKFTADTVAITMENGSATYQKISVAASGDWVCRLVESTFEPMPHLAARADGTSADLVVPTTDVLAERQPEPLEINEAAFLGDATATLTAAITEEESRLAAAASRRRRLALLSQ